MSAEIKSSNPTSIPAGTWTVDPASSELRFGSRGMFGLVPVKGTFSSFEGDLQVHDGAAHGTLRIAAATLDTGNAKRDEHLRSADFFNVKDDPTVTFTLSGVGSATDGTPELNGTLSIRNTTLAFTAPLKIEQTSPERLTLSTEVSVDRTAAGVGWSKMGMIQGKAHLHASVTLVAA